MKFFVFGELENSIQGELARKSEKIKRNLDNSVHSRFCLCAPTPRRFTSQPRTSQARSSILPVRTWENCNSQPKTCNVFVWGGGVQLPCKKDEKINFQNNFLRIFFFN